MCKMMSELYVSVCVVGFGHYREHRETGCVLTEAGDTVKVIRADGQILVLQEVEGLEGEASILRHAIRVQDGLLITFAPAEKYVLLCE